MGRPDAIWLLAGALVAGIVGVAFLTGSPFADHLVLDAYRYDALARELAERNLAPEGPFHQAPLYPTAIGLLYRLGGGPTVAFVLQLAMAATLPWLFFRIGARLFSTRAGHVAALLALFYGPLIAFAPRLLPTIPTIWLQSLLLLRVPRSGERSPGRWIETGILSALLVLLRPNFLLFVLWLVVVGLTTKRLARGAALRVALPVLLTVGSTTAYHVANGHGLLLVSANAGETFYHGNNPRAAGTYALMAGLESADILKQAEVSRRLAEQSEGRSLTSAEVSRHWFREGIRFASDDPGRFVWLEWQKLRRLLGAEESPDIYSPDLETRLYTPAFHLTPLRLHWILPAAVAGVVVAWRSLPFAWVGLALTHAATLLLFYVSNRYRLPLEALLLVPAGVAVARIGERRTQVALAAGIVLTLLIRLTPSPGDRAREEALMLTNLGVSLGKERDLRGAAAAFQNAVDRDPSWPRGHHYLGRAKAMEGDALGALPHYRRALELDPDATAIRIDLATVLARTGACDEALETLEGLGPAAENARQRIRSACDGL